MQLNPLEHTLIRSVSRETGIEIIKREYVEYKDETFYSLSVEKDIDLFFDKLIQKGFEKTDSFIDNNLIYLR